MRIALIRNKGLGLYIIGGLNDLPVSDSLKHNIYKQGNPV